MSTCFMFIYDTLMCCFRSLLHLNMCSLLLLLNPNPHPSSIPTPSVWVCHPLPPCSSLKKFQKQNFASAEPKTGPKNKILACSEGKTAPPPPKKTLRRIRRRNNDDFAAPKSRVAASRTSPSASVAGNNHFNQDVASAQPWRNS